MSDNKNKKRTWMILAAIGGCLGCGGLLLAIGALLSFGAWNVVGESAPGESASVDLASVPAVPDGWVIYEHAGGCPGNRNLALTSFRVAHSREYVVLPCREQGPQPWAYVNFHQETDEGAAVRQLTMNYVHGFPNLSLLQRAADSFTPQIGAEPTRSIDESRLQARGGALLRRDSAFDVHTPTGVFVAGTYVYRQVVVPNTGQRHSVLVTLLQRAPEGAAAAIAASQAELLQVVESLQY